VTAGRSPPTSRSTPRQCSPRSLNRVHLPKVGSPANEQWEHETHQKEHFASPIAKIIFLVLFVGGVVGLLALTL
jgi:hypothetical protein